MPRNVPKPKNVTNKSHQLPIWRTSDKNFIKKTNEKKVWFKIKIFFKNIYYYFIGRHGKKNT